MKKISDLVIETLEEQGIQDVFLVSGGMIMHLLDSLGNSKKIKYWCNYHEQSSAIAAEGYARVTGKLGVCFVTSGPGSTNALAGIANAWVDSIPVLVISGQVRSDLIANYNELRQLGPQEINIIDMVRPVTKYAATVLDADKIEFELLKAIKIATSGRPGPVWLNIPLDIQALTIDRSKKINIDDIKIENEQSPEDIKGKIAQIIEHIKSAERPLLIAGNGIRLGNGIELFEKFLDKTKIKTLLTIGAMDLMAENDANYAGKFGAIGQRRANFALQNSDLLVCLGTGMAVSLIGFNTKEFAPNAKKILVNIDPAELTKKHFIPDIGLACDIKDFFNEFLQQSKEITFKTTHQWNSAIDEWRSRYPIIIDEYKVDNDKYVNTYLFANILAKHLTEKDILLTGNALDPWSIYQAFEVKAGQRVFTNVNYGAMGWDIPASVGAAVGQKANQVILFTGDGSLQFSIHELLTISTNKLNVKIFVINNNGYESIRYTQNNFFDGHYVGSDQNSGVGNPKFDLLAKAYGIEYSLLVNMDDVHAKLDKILASPNAVLCELNVAYTQSRIPRSMSYKRPDGVLESRPIYDMAPFLPREEITENITKFQKNE